MAEKLLLLKKETYKECRILILNVSINNSDYILIKLYNANTEIEQMNVLINMCVRLEEFDINKKCQLIIVGVFITFFDTN